jgi:hypothetical protein
MELLVLQLQDVKKRQQEKTPTPATTRYVVVVLHHMESHGIFSLVRFH